MSNRMRRAGAWLLAVCMCVLGAAAGLSLSGGRTEVAAKGKDKVDGMIFWGTSGLARMHELITDPNMQAFSSDSNRNSKAEAEQHEWVGVGGYSAGMMLNYGEFSSGYTPVGYAKLKDWYPGWNPSGNDLTQNRGGREAQYWKFDETADSSNPNREPDLMPGSANIGEQIMAVLDRVTTTGHKPGDVWGQDGKNDGGNENDQLGDGIAIVIWAGEDWVVRNWDSNDLGFVGQEDGGGTGTMDTYGTAAVLMKYWMGLDLEGFGTSHSYNPASWANPIDDGSVMHKQTKDDGVSGDETGRWNGDGSFSGGSTAGTGLSAVSGGHVGDQEVAVYSCNDSIYPNLEWSTRLNDDQTTDILDKGTNEKGSPGSGKITSPYGTAYAYTDTQDGGTQTGADSGSGKNSQEDSHVQPEGNSRQVSNRYTTQWVEKDNGYHDYQNSGFSYNGVDDGINVDLSTHALSGRSDDIGDGYADGRKDSLATQVGTLFARVLSGYDYQVEYLTQDTDPSAIPHNTDDTQLDDWYEITYLYVTKRSCSHYPVDCWDSCNQFEACDHNIMYQVSAERIRVRSRCDTTKDAGGTNGAPKKEQQTSGEADQGYADSYHIHVLGGIGMFDTFLSKAGTGMIQLPSAGSDDDATCNVPAQGFTGDYDDNLVGVSGGNFSREDTGYDRTNRNLGAATSIGHTCWEHVPATYVRNEEPISHIFDDNTYPYRPQLVNDEKDPQARFMGAFDFCDDSNHNFATGDYAGKCPVCLSNCCVHVGPPEDWTHCTCPQSYVLSWGCPYLRVIPVVEVAGFKDPQTGRQTHNIIPSQWQDDCHGGYINLNSYGAQYWHAEHAAAAQRYLRTWGNDNAMPKYLSHIGPSAQQQEAQAKFPYGQIPYETASNPHSSDVNHVSDAANHDMPGGTQYQTGSNFVNYKDDSHVYIRTWYTNPNKPIMKYVTETRHVTGYIESWKDKYPDVQVYVFGLGPYSKSTTDDTRDAVWVADHDDVTAANYWATEFGRDTNYDGKIDGQDRVRSNNKNALDATTARQDGMTYTQLADTPTKNYYTDTEGMWGSADSIEVRNEKLKHDYLITEPYFTVGGTTVDTTKVAYADDKAVKERLMQLYPTMVKYNTMTDAAGNMILGDPLDIGAQTEINTLFDKMVLNQWIFRMPNGKFYENGSWLDLQSGMGGTYGGTVPAKDKYLDEIARTNRIDKARQDYNAAVKANLRGAQYIDIWDLTLEHNPYFQYGAMVDSAAVSTGGAYGGSGNAVNAYHGKYYDQTTYSWIFHMMWSTILALNPDEAEDEPISANLYDLSAALTAYANTVLSVKGRSNSGGGTDGSSAAIMTGSSGDVSHFLPDLTTVGFFGAGAALGYGDTAYGFVPAVVVPISESSSSIDYKSLVQVEMGKDDNSPENSAMYIYARYGHLLQDMGLDETGIEAAASPRLATGLATSVGYICNASLGVVWNTAFEILDVLNPFRFLIGTGHGFNGVATANGVDPGAGANGETVTDPWDGTKAHGTVTTGQVWAQQIQGLDNNDSRIPAAMKPLIDYMTNIYLLMQGIGLWIVLPLMLVLFFASTLMLRKKWTQEAMKFLVPLVFISVGVPILGAMYTSVLHDCRELVNMSASPSSQLVAATFVDFEGWARQSRLAPPQDASKTDGSSVELISEGSGGSSTTNDVTASASGYASGDSLKNLRKIAWSINKSTNIIPAMRDWDSVYNASGVDISQLDDGAYWTSVTTGEYNGRYQRASYGTGDDWLEQWQDSMDAFREIMSMLQKYTNGDFYFASTFNSETMAHFQNYHTLLVGSRRGNDEKTDSGSASDAGALTAEGVPIASSPAATYSEMDNKYKLYGLFASASHADDWLNRTPDENESLLLGLAVELKKDDATGESSGVTITGSDVGVQIPYSGAASQNFTGFNPFANGRITAEAIGGNTGVADESTVIRYTRDGVTSFETDPSSSKWKQHNGLDWASIGGLSTVSMYNYLISDFDSAAVKTYSAHNVINLHQERAHYSVNAVGSGGTGTVYWLSCVVYMICCAVIGFIYALGMTIQNIKNGLNMIMSLPAAMLGIRKSIVSVCAIVVSLIFQIVSSVALYSIVAQILMVLATLMDNISRTSFGQLKVSADIGGLLAYAGQLAPAALQGSWASQLFYMIGMIGLMAFATYGACYLAPAMLRVNDMAFDWFMCRVVLPEGVMASYLRKKAVVRAGRRIRAGGRVRGRVRIPRRLGIPAYGENTACENAGQGV